MFYEAGGNPSVQGLWRVSVSLGRGTEAREQGDPHAWKILLFCRLIYKGFLIKGVISVSEVVGGGRRGGGWEIAGRDEHKEEEKVLLFLCFVVSEGKVEWARGEFGEDMGRIGGKYVKKGGGGQNGGWNEGDLTLEKYCEVYIPLLLQHCQPPVCDQSVLKDCRPKRDDFLSSKHFPFSRFPHCDWVSFQTQ